MTRETVTLADQARGYWVASAIFRRGILPADVADALAARGELTPEIVRATATETLCVLGAIATAPRLRSRIMKEWPSLIPVAPVSPAPGGAA